jgi:hypothetical protein
MKKIVYGGKTLYKGDGFHGGFGDSSLLFYKFMLSARPL